jgi:hypothetical protein
MRLNDQRTNKNADHMIGVFVGGICHVKQYSRSS